MGEYIQGYVTPEIIRMNSGSPATWWQFQKLSQSIMIDNLGSNAIYFNLTGPANPANSGTAYLNATQTIVFDVQTGSISIQGSGLTTPTVQLFRLT